MVGVFGSAATVAIVIKAVDEFIDIVKLKVRLVEWMGSSYPSFKN